MIAADRQKFLEIVVGFAELKGKSLSAPALELYWRSMRGWSLSDFQAAAEQLIRTSEFMPTPKDFEDLRKAGQQTPGEAFAKARQILGGALRSELPSLTSGDARIDATMLAVGGWEALAMSTSENIGFLERRFAEHYESISDAEDVREALPQIAGPSRSRLSGPQPIAKLIGGNP